MNGVGETSGGSGSRSIGRCLVGAALLLFAISARSRNACAGAVSGVVWGPSHAFYLSPPTGWVLDNRSGVSQGLYAVFYPEGSSWADSTRVMYVNTVKRERRDIATLIREDTARIRSESAGVKVTIADPIPIGTGSAEVRRFSGDRWGNCEAVAYIAERNIFVLLVLTARNQDLFLKSLNAFKSMVKSYEFLTDDPENATGPFELLQDIADRNNKTPAGAKYDLEWGKSVFRQYPKLVDTCFKTFGYPDSKPLDLLVRVSADGAPVRLLYRPQGELYRCIAEPLRNGKFPKPPSPLFWEHFHLEFVNDRLKPTTESSACPVIPPSPFLQHHWNQFQSANYASLGKPALAAVH